MNSLQKQEATMLAHMIQRLDKYVREAETYGADPLRDSLLQARKSAQSRLLSVVGAGGNEDGMVTAKRLEAAGVCAVVWDHGEPKVEVEGVYA